MKKFKVMLMMVACTSLFVLATALPAFADQAMVANTPVNVRDAPSVDGTIIGYLAVGDKVQSQGLDGGWYKIAYNNQTAYVYSEYLTGDIETATTAMVTTADLNLRTDPTTAGDVITTIPNGTKIDVTPVEDGWYKTNYQGAVGYVFGSYLAASTPSASTTTTKMTATGDVYVRDAANDNGNVLGILKKGDTIDSTGKSGEWYIVNYNGKTGYVYQDWLAAANTTKTMTATTTANIRDKASMDGNVIGWLAEGKTITVTGTTEDGWDAVDFNGATAYIYGDLLK